YPGFAVTLLTGGCALAVVLIAWTAGLLKNSPETETMRRPTGVAAEQRESVERDDHRLAAEDAPEAVALVKAFFDAKTLEEKAKLVRGGDAMLPFMRDYYALHPDEPGSVRVDHSIEFKS